MLSDSELFSRGLQPQYLYVPETSALVPTGDADMFVVHLAGLAQSVAGAPVNPAEPQEHAEMLWTWMRGVEVVTDHNVPVLTKVIAGMFALVIIFTARSGLMVMFYDFLLTYYRLPGGTNTIHLVTLDKSKNRVMFGGGDVQVVISPASCDRYIMSVLVY